MAHIYGCFFCGRILTLEEVNLPAIHRLGKEKVLMCADDYIEQASIETELVQEAIASVDVILAEFEKAKVG
jgi:hypothetical protein